MPRCIYKKLMSARCTLEDLSELQPTLAKGLKDILAYEDAASFSDVYGDLCFQITYDIFGV